MQAEPLVDGLEGVAGQEQAEVLLTNEHVYAQRSGGHGEGGTAGVDQHMADTGEQRGKDAQGVEQAAEAEGEDNDGLGEKHAADAAARNQLGHIAQIGAFWRRVAVEEVAAELFYAGAAVQVGEHEGNGDGDDDGVNRVHAAHG